MNVLELAEKSAYITHNYGITPEVYLNFQSCSKDYNPLHTDDTFAVEKGFKGCVMYGNILNAFISHFVGMLLPEREIMIQTQDISYHNPLFLHDIVTLEARIDNISEAVNIVRYKLKFYRKEEEKTILIAKGHVQIGLL